MRSHLVLTLRPAQSLPHSLRSGQALKAEGERLVWRTQRKNRDVCATRGIKSVVSKC